MAAARNNNQVVDDRDKETISTRLTDRTQIYQFLTGLGLNPSDYIFSPLPEETPSQAQTPTHTSAFSNYPSKQGQNNQPIFRPQSRSLFTSGRPLSYAQHPPPLSPPAAASAVPAPPPTFNPPPVTSQPEQQQGPPPSLGQSSNNQQSGPPPASSTSGLSFFRNLSSLNTQNPSSQPPPPPAQDMSQHILSPHRSPPPPPPHHHLSPSPHHSTIHTDHYLRQINCHENPPVKVVKPSTQNVVYRKEIRIRYLQPPTPPPPAPIIIREKHLPPIPPQSPLLIRERKPDAHTPPPLTIRERPPTPPVPLQPYVIEKNLPAAPPQPRQIIIERLPTPPPKPRTVIFEKWLPYKKVKRPVLLQKAPPLEPIKPTRNVIIEYEPLKATTVRRVIEEGVFKVDPQQFATYNAQSHGGGTGDIRIVERIEDLPPPSEQLMRVLQEYNQPLHHDSSASHSFGHQSPPIHQSASPNVPSAIQKLFGGGQAASNADRFTNVSRASGSSSYRQGRVQSTGYNSSMASPVSVRQRSRSSHSSNRHQQFSPHYSPHMDSAY